jgi:hypothetical protein
MQINTKTKSVKFNKSELRYIAELRDSLSIGTFIPSVPEIAAAYEAINKLESLIDSSGSIQFANDAADEVSP